MSFDSIMIERLLGGLALALAYIILFDVAPVQSDMQYHLAPMSERVRQLRMEREALEQRQAEVI